MPAKKAPVKKVAPKAPSKAPQGFINALKAREAAIEKKGGPKGKQEKQLEKTISKLSGNKFVGKR